MKAVIAIVGLALLVSSASAYPWLFANSASCGKHPQQAFGPHLPPQLDPSTSIALTLVNTTAALAPSAPLCPGKKYQVKVQWNPNLFNHVLLTTTAGSWANLPIPGCNLSTYLVPAVTQIIDTLTVPCNATGRIQINVTHSQPGQAYLQASLSKNVSAACAAVSCPKTPSPPLKKAPPPPKKTSPPPPKKASPPPPKKASPPPPKKASPPPPKKASPPPPKKASPPPPKKASPPPPKKASPPPPKKASPPPAGR